MLIQFTGDMSDSLKEGVKMIQKQLGFQVSETGIQVQVRKSFGQLEVSLANRQGYIKYEQPIHFYRALSLFVENARRDDSFHVSEQPQFAVSGAMFDVSRNGVPKVDSIKELIRMMALMGLNALMLYTEDNITLDSQPYFGYMRGRYSFEELKECDDYAAMFGIEVIPCIQTLGHLTQALKWNYMNNIKDTDDILLVGEQKTYAFIDELIQSAKAPFRSNRIHIGMDEAHQVGLGKYLERNGFRNRFDIMNEHLREVLDITNKYGLHPMIWSDMYFRLASKTGQYYDLDAVVPEEVISEMPRDVKYVYWDYYHEDEEFYIEYIRRHKLFGSDPVFAGGIWCWTGIVPNYGKTFRTTNAALTACKKERIKEVFATVWGDNGAEADLFSSILGLQLFAEHTYAVEVDEEKLRSRFMICTGGDYDAFMNVKYLDETPGTMIDNLGEANPSKYLLYQDVLLGLFDRHVQNLDLAKHYEYWETKIKEYAKNSGRWFYLFSVYEKLSTVMRLKCDLGLRMKDSYDRNHIDDLNRFANQELPQLIVHIEELRDAHREQWFRTNKPFGWEVLDIRYGGLLARVGTAISRLNDYISGKIDVIEELQENRFEFDAFYGWESESLGHCNVYHRIVTAGKYE